MPVSTTYPGVYVQEVPSGVRTIVGVSTSIGMFLGTLTKGPINQPQRCLNYSSFKDKFGEDSSAGQLAQYLKLFFLNGGTDCYVMRIANGANKATVTLKNESGAEVLKLEAKDRGLAGESIRAVVTYSGPQPEVAFNMGLFRWVIDNAGQRQKTDAEQWPGLSMDPQSPNYAPAFLSANSKLINASPAAGLPAAQSGTSVSGRVLDSAGLLAAWNGLLQDAKPKRRFELSADGNQISVNLTALQTFNTQVALENGLQTFINSQYATLGLVNTRVETKFVAGPANFVRLQFRSLGSGDVFIRPAALEDLAVPMMLGTDQGGLEVSGRAGQRPAPNGIVFRPYVPGAQGPDLTVLNDFGDLDQSALVSLTLDAFNADGTVTAKAVLLHGALPAPNTGTVPDIVTVTAAGAKVRQDAAPVSPNGNSDGVREKLGIIAQRLNVFIPDNGAWKWKAAVWGSRLAIWPTDTGGIFFSNNFAVQPASVQGDFGNNVSVYTVGQGGNNTGQQTSPAATASDGNPPQATDYDAAYEVIDKQVDLFNLMILPPPANPAVTVQSLYGAASVFCQKRRAFLLMDPPDTWQDAQTASTGVAAMRVGLVKDYSAVFFPRLMVSDNGLNKPMGPAGAIAGLCARIDGTRGVWKAPAGTEADLRGIVGLEQRLSDGENGILNPRAINTLRVFPDGIVNWGARTNDGDDNNPSDYKYVPVRRLALFLEESLYRGLKWVVFEPNAEPLWSQIRLNVGAFMHDLFRQGAFQGQTPKDAYFVKCDSETTTQTDINLGRVNIWVGFAPLKPAEFVILYLQQMAGQIQT